MAEEISAISDDLTEDANSRRVRIDSRKWLLAKLAAKTYGDRAEVDVDVNVAATAALGARDAGAKVAVLETAPESERGGNTFFVAGSTRWIFNGMDDIREVLDLSEEELRTVDFGTYTREAVGTVTAPVYSGIYVPPLPPEELAAAVRQALDGARDVLRVAAVDDHARLRWGISAARRWRSTRCRDLPRRFLHR